jgi:hypothetical protein
VAFFASRHPDAVAAVAARVLSTRLNADIYLQRLDFSFDPLGLEAHGIQLRSKKDAEGVQGRIGVLRIDAALEGRVGRRTLRLKAVEMDGWDLQLPFGLAPGVVLPGDKSASLVTRTVNGLVEFLIFHRVQLDTLSVSDGHFDMVGPDRHLTVAIREASLAADGGLRLAAAGRFEHAKKEVLLEAPDIRVTGAAKLPADRAQLRGELALEGAILTTGRLQAGNISVGAQIDWQGIGQPLTVDSARVSVGYLKQQAAQVWKEALGHLVVDFSGAVDPKQGAIRLPRWRVRLAEGVEAEGRLQYGGSPAPQASVVVSRGRASADRLIALVGRFPGASLPGLALHGPLGFAAVLQGIHDGTRWQWEVEADAHFDDLAAVLEPSSVKISTRLAGDLFLKGNLPDLHLAAQLKAADGRILYPGIQPAAFSAELAANGRYPDFTVEVLEMAIPLLAATGEGHLPIKDIRLQAQDGRVNAAARTFSFTDGILSSDRIGPLTFSLTGDRTEQRLQVLGRGAGVAAAALTMASSGWKLTTDERLQASALLRDGACRFKARLDLEGLSFEDPLQTAFGENIALQAEIDGRFDMAAKRAALNASLRSPGGEILYDQFYLDLGQRPMALDAEFGLDLGSGEWELADFALRVKALAELRARGRTQASSPGASRLDLAVALPTTELKPLFAHLVREPFAARMPALTTLSVGGTVSMDLRLQSDAAGLLVTGNAMWADGRLASDTRGELLDGVQLDFPVWFQPRARPGSEAALDGGLRIDRLVLPVLGQQAIDWRMRSGPGHIDILSQTGFDFAGGRVEVGPIHLANAYRADRLLTTEVSVASVPAKRFLGKIWPDAAMGEISGRLDSVGYRDGRLTSRGRVTAHVFGGRVVVIDPKVAGLFSPVPVWSADVLLEDLNLGDLTGGTAFGRVDGILDGSIDNLEIAAGQPQRFDLFLETVKRAGVRQRISVKAVDSIAQIGGGQSAFMGLAGSVLKFMPGFAYKKIGIRSSLRNDVFTVNGTVRESGTEFLVRRGGLAGVDVINRDPENRIRFKEMVKRIRYALAADSRPVVNMDN